MAKHIVTEFGIEVQFSEKVMAGLSKLEKDVMKAAVTMERALNRAFKTNGAKVMEETLGKIVRDTNNASRQMKKALTDAFDIKGAGKQSIREFENDAKAAANNVAKQFRNAMKFGSPYGRGAGGGRPPRGGGSGGGGAGGSGRPPRGNAGDERIQRHFNDNTDNGMVRSMRRLGLHKEVEAMNTSLQAVRDKYHGTGNYNDYRKEARRVINSYKDVVDNHRAYNRELQKSKFMNQSLQSSTMNLVKGFASVYTAIELFNKAIDAGTKRQGAVMASNAVFGNLAPNNKNAALEARMFSAGFGKQIGQSMTDTLMQYTKFAASAAPSMGIQGAQDFYKNATVYGRLLGLSNDKLEHAMLAFEQMAGKGKVSSEELKGQLAEALPGAEGIFAKALYGSNSKENVAKLLADMKAGAVDAADALPKVSKELKRLADQAGGIEAISKTTAVALENVKGELDSFFVNIYKGMEGGLGDEARALSETLYNNATTAKYLGVILGWVMEKFVGITDTIGNFGLFVHSMSGEIRDAFHSLDPETQKLIKGFLDLADNMAGTVVVVTTLTKAAGLLKSLIPGTAGNIFTKGWNKVKGLFGGGTEAAATSTAESTAADVASNVGKKGLSRLIPGLGEIVMMSDIYNKYQDLSKTATDATPGTTSLWGAIKARAAAGGGYNYEHGIKPEGNPDLKGLPDWMKQNITIPPDAFKGVQMPTLRGRLIVDVPQPDGSFKTQTVDLLSDQTESQLMNANPMGGGWGSPSTNVGWSQLQVPGAQ